MYKVSLNVLEGVLKSLEESNAILKKLPEAKTSIAVRLAIRENEKQIQIIKLNYRFNGN